MKLICRSKKNYDYIDYKIPAWPSIIMFVRPRLIVNTVSLEDDGGSKREKRTVDPGERKRT